MPKGNDDESTKENKAERTDYELTLPPEEEWAEFAYRIESFRRVFHRDIIRRSSRISNLYDQDTEGSAVLANATRVIEPTSLSTSLVYSGSGMIPQKEVSQQSDVQSARTTVDLKKSTSLPFRHNLHQEKENESTWLFEVLNNIGVNDSYRKICREEAFIQEIIDTFTLSPTLWSVGSCCEGTFIPGKESDADSIQCHEELIVIENVSIADIGRASLLIVRDSNTPAGYVKLQLVMNSVPIMLKHWPAICVDCPDIEPCFTTDKFDRIVLSGILTESLDNCPLFSRDKNKPAAKLENYPNINIDTVQCHRCKTWPTMANEWLNRHRCYGWPTTETIEELKLLGFFVVKKGLPFSPEKDLEWRISLSLQERKLIFDLTDVQYKCYVILKMLNRDVLRLDCITTYHWKTCLFYMIEENESTVWEKTLLFRCVDLCIRRMLQWVRRGRCPNYFIPGENLFDGRMDDGLLMDSENKLVELLNIGFAILLRVQSYNICEYVRSRKNVKWSQKLKAESIKVYTKKVYMRKAVLYKAAMSGVKMLYEKFKPIGKTPNVIEILWRILDHIQRVDTVSEHTHQESRHALSLLLPFVYTCLAGNISAMCIQLPNSQVRDFLLFGSYTYFMKGDLSGRLKFISVLYAAGCYKECEWYLGQEDEKYIKHNPSVCVCKYILGVRDPMDINITEISQLKMSTCVFFLPTELPVIPAALKFEIFKHFGISSHIRSSDDLLWNWDHLAVVDSNVFYFMLKFLVNRRVKKAEYALYDILKIQDCVFEFNVIHTDVAFNLMAWCYCSVGWTGRSLCLLRHSWHAKRPLSTLMLLLKNETKQQHYLLNAAKLHLLVILYNIWFNRNQPIFNFCFQCFSFCKKAHQKCNNCKTATYCSKQCKQNNWKIHEAVCKLVNRYRNV